MLRIKKNTSTITLRLYVDLLRKASHGNLGYISKLQKIERRAAIELRNSGLLSEGEFGGSEVKIVQEAVITPEGASALEKWSSYLRDEGNWYKFGSAIVRFLWVIVGALAASLTEIMNKLT